MGKFCTNCGAELKEKSAFCGECGKAPVNQSQNVNSISNQNMSGFVGFSGRINDPEVIKNIEDDNKKGRGCIFIGIPLPLIILLIAGVVTDEVSTTDALVIGGGISFVFLIGYLFASSLGKAKHTWDGVVTDKKTKNKIRRFRDGEVQSYTEYTVYFRTDKGKKEMSVKRSYNDPEFNIYYNYLSIGDRVRYHPRLSFKYEKYDKSRDSVIPCMFCKTMNDIRNDRCESCNRLLFK